MKHVTFRKKLYAKKEVSINDIEKDFENIDIPKLFQDQSQMLEDPLTFEEISVTLKKI